MIVALARSLKNRFPAAKALGAAALCCLALAACDSEPLFDTSSVPAYQKSLDAIEARLNVQDRNRLKIALRTLEVGGAVEFTQAGLPRVPANIAALEGVDNSTLLLDRIRPKIEGKTAAAVIGIVVADIDAEIARAEGQLGGTDADKTLSKIVIENERYYWERTGNPDHAKRPIFDLQRQRQGNLACFCSAACWHRAAAPRLGRRARSITPSLPRCNLARSSK